MWLPAAGTKTRAGRPWIASTTFLWCSWLADAAGLASDAR
jgi:hypothetical protein